MVVKNNLKLFYFPMNLPLVQFHQSFFINEYAPPSDYFQSKTIHEA